MVARGKVPRLYEVECITDSVYVGLRERVQQNVSAVQQALLKPPHGKITVRPEDWMMKFYCTLIMVWLQQQMQEQNQRTIVAESSTAKQACIDNWAMEPRGGSVN